MGDTVEVALLFFFSERQQQMVHVVKVIPPERPLEQMVGQISGFLARLIVEISAQGPQDRDGYLLKNKAILQQRFSFSSAPGAKIEKEILEEIRDILQQRICERTGGEDHPCARAVHHEGHP